ncbi:helix-turn-helix domain-containing protein [Shimia sagamensis]|uniref:Helix-turn-helix domain-containing protein n=1 Tax=Shimia sagamensis TaxID=1566352 RepID=A0ABY1PM11_9RHOB|nr:helix-turn-helix domain-containing protein [Shimia sagamensis]SMP34802.1 Helix-turn-helix domain-containing protein [Shimia sagamensis]
MINNISDWDIDFRQTEPGALQTRLDFRSGNDVTLMDISMSHAVHQTGVSPKGFISVGLVRPNRIKSWNGCDFSASELVCFGNTKPFDGVGTTRFRGLTISISHQFSEALADEVGLPISEVLFGGSQPVIVRNCEYLENLHDAKRRSFAGGGQSLSREQEEDVLLNLLQATHRGRNSEDKSAPFARSKARRLAIDAMTANDTENLTIGDICHESAASWRTLDRAFKEEFGIGPKRYYLNLRLSRVRTALMDNEGNRNVVDIANDFGFWHMGDFAREYRKLFGDLPSVALKNNS